MQRVKQIKSRERRKKAVRGKIHGTAQRPRLTVFRSNQHIYLQAIDDNKAITLAAVSDLGGDKSGKKKKSKMEQAKKVAEEMVKKLKKAKIQKLVFDRGAYRYHGRIKLIAEVLREAGLKV
ncbi:MAG: 50S ribosomal protein L18 [Patescibacteria group bacterium]|nr:50S ribosomal protein L18 [Patescibacteria group bacterium]